MLAGRLRSEIDSSDTVARLGGDEFAIILTGTDPRAEAERVAGRLMIKVTAPYYLGAGRAEVGVSVGAALWGGRGNLSDDILRRADEALYDAKRAGRGTFRFEPGAWDTKLAA